MVHLSAGPDLSTSKPVKYSEQETLLSWFARHSPNASAKYWPMCNNVYLYLSATLCENGLLDQMPAIVATPVSEPVYRYLQVLPSQILFDLIRLIL